MNARQTFTRPPRAIAAGLLWHSGCHCPGCGHRQWNVGRVTAECAVCDTALIIAEADGLTHLKGDTKWPNA